MIRSGLIGALLSLTLAGAAAAEPFQSFADLCLSTDADAEAAKVVAKGSGWTDVTAQMGADIGEEFQDTAVYLNFDPANVASLSEGNSMDILMTGWGDGEAIMGMKGVVLDVCGVMSPQADAQAMSRQLTGHLGLPSSTKLGWTIWMYSRQGGRFVSEAGLMEAGDERFLAATRERSLYFVYLIEEDGLAGLVVGAVRPAAKAQDR